SNETVRWNQIMAPAAPQGNEVYGHARKALMLVWVSEQQPYLFSRDLNVSIIKVIKPKASIRAKHKAVLRRERQMNIHSQAIAVIICASPRMVRQPRDLPLYFLETRLRNLPGVFRKLLRIFSLGICERRGQRQQHRAH